MRYHVQLVVTADYWRGLDAKLTWALNADTAGDAIVKVNELMVGKDSFSCDVEEVEVAE